MNTELTNKLLKYLGQGIVIYLLFKYVPKEPMPNKEIILMAIIVILSYAVFENLHALYYKNNSELLSQTQCNTQCAIKSNIYPTSLEHMENITINQPVLPPTTPAVSAEESGVVSAPVIPIPTVVSVPPNELDIKVENLEKEREKDLADIKAAPINSGIYANPEIIQGGIKRNPDGSFTIIPNKNPQKIYQYPC